jgi:hypothetical protein
MRTLHGDGASKSAVPRVLAAALGTALQVADSVAELGAETARTVHGQLGALTRRAERGYLDASQRGDQAIDRAVAEAARRLDQAADAAASWADRTIVRRVARSVTPYLVDELVPEVIEGVLPKIRSEVIPIVIEDLAGDEHVREMVAQQSQGMLDWTVAEVRHVCADGDDRVETALHKVLGRRNTRP